MTKATSTKFGHLTDKELLVLIKEDQEYLGEVYKRCKAYSIQFMRKMTSSKISEYELEDVEYKGVNEEEMMEFFKKLELHSLIKKHNKTGKDTKKEFDFKIIRDVFELDEILIKDKFVNPLTVKASSNHTLSTEMNLIFLWLKETKA